MNSEKKTQLNYILILRHKSTFYDEEGSRLLKIMGGKIKLNSRTELQRNKRINWLPSKGITSNKITSNVEQLRMRQIWMGQIEMEQFRMEQHRTEQLRMKLLCIKPPRIQQIRLNLFTSLRKIMARSMSCKVRSVFSWSHNCSLLLRS